MADKAEVCVFPNRGAASLPAIKPPRANPEDRPVPEYNLVRLAVLNKKRSGRRFGIVLIPSHLPFHNIHPAFAPF